MKSSGMIRDEVNEGFGLDRKNKLIVAPYHATDSEIYDWYQNKWDTLDMMNEESAIEAFRDNDDCVKIRMINGWKLKRQ